MRSFHTIETRAILILILIMMGMMASCGDSPDSPSETRRLLLTLEHIGEANTYTGSQGQDVVLALAPGVFTVSRTPSQLFTPGAVATDELEALAEFGEPTGLLEASRQQAAISMAALTGDIDNADYEESPILPGARTTLVITYEPGDRLELAMMLGPSNDTFLGSLDGGIDLDALEDGEVPAEMLLGWWDAGTEVNEPLGEGMHQPPATTGEEQNGTITLVSGGMTKLPGVENVIRLSVERRQ